MTNPACTVRGHSHLLTGPVQTVGGDTVLLCPSGYYQWFKIREETTIRPSDRMCHTFRIFGWNGYLWGRLRRGRWGWRSDQEVV